MHEEPLLLSLAVVAIISCAEASKTITVMAFGEGDSYENALQVALQDAVRQVNGSVVRSDVRRTSTSQETVTVVGDQEQQNATSVEGSSGGTREVLKGVVKGHRIKDKKTLPNGRVEVKIEADVLKYESPVGNSGLPKVAQLSVPVKAPAGASPAAALTVPATCAVWKTRGLSSLLHVMPKAIYTQIRT